MSYHLIKRINQGGGWLAKPGSKKSFTHSIHRARIFDSLEEAQAECCPDNEIPVPAPYPPHYST